MLSSFSSTEQSQPFSKSLRTDKQTKHTLEYTSQLSQFSSYTTNFKQLVTLGKKKKVTLTPEPIVFLHFVKARTTLSDTSHS